MSHENNMTVNAAMRPAPGRDSNLELFRCITMLLIVAHHYVVNSGLTSTDGPVMVNPCSWRSLFLLIFGAWGKTGINCFVLITGYYMCRSHITGRKYFRLLGEIYFYKILICSIFTLTGYQQVTMKMMAYVILPFVSINRGFTGCFILFYLFLPFLAILVKNMTRHQHVWLTALCIFIYTVVEPIPGVSVPMHYVSWFMVLFLVSSFLRLHADEYMKKRNDMWSMGGLLLLLIIDIASVAVVAWLSTRCPVVKKLGFYFFMGESNRPLPFLTGVMAFIVFKKMSLPCISLINMMGGSTFGVLLIHASSDAMRRWLWKDLLHNVEMYASKWLPIHAVGSVLGIFIVCTAIDRLRIRFVEPLLMTCYDRLRPYIVSRFDGLENWFIKKMKNFTGA